MKLVGLWVLLSLIAVSPVALGYSDNIALSPEPTSVEDMQVDHLRSAFIAGRKLRVQLHLRNFTSHSSKKIEKAKEILETVINSPQFRRKVLGFHFRKERRFHRNKDMNNREIYDHLMTGAEDLLPEVDGVMNFDLTLYKSWNPWSEVKGYTKPDTMRIWLNTRWFAKRSWTPVKVAGNLAHEWTHKMGFGHAFEDNPKRDFSVPYAIGHIVIDVANQLGY